jgi:hypothetical protein
MTTIDLSRFKKTDAFKAVMWLSETFGPQGDRWVLKNLAQIEFRKDRDATLFLLHWS